MHQFFESRIQNRMQRRTTLLTLRYQRVERRPLIFSNHSGSLFHGSWIESRKGGSQEAIINIIRFDGESMTPSSSFAISTTHLILNLPFAPLYSLQIDYRVSLLGYAWMQMSSWRMMVLFHYLVMKHLRVLY